MGSGDRIGEGDECWMRNDEDKRQMTGRVKERREGGVDL